MIRLIALAWLALLSTLAQAASPPLVVGSKRFTESYVVGEIVHQTLQQAGLPAEHKPGLGNTGILEQALASGAVDVYPEYTGTIVRELLKRTQAGEPNPSLEQLNTWLAPRGLKAAVPLGFNNTYALAVRESVAERLALRSISDLARLPPGALQVGLSHEFQQRADGWPALRQAYGLSWRPVPPSTMAWPMPRWKRGRSTSSTSTALTRNSAAVPCACWWTTAASFRATTPCC